MTRPRVPDNKRKRISLACDMCKRRKQKCDGENPCSSCVKRNLTCVYSPNGIDRPSSGSPDSTSKRRMLETHVPAEGGVPASRLSPGKEVSVTNWQRRSSLIGGSSPALEVIAEETPVTVGHSSRKHARDHTTPNSTSKPLRDNDLEYRYNTSGPEEEQELYSTTRMLLDQTGRLQYIGDSASLSYVQTLRHFVREVNGSSAFTEDPKKTQIVENQISLPGHITIPCPLPDPRTANILVQSYFTNTCGLFELFDKQWFQKTLAEFYEDQLAFSGSPFVCILYLVFAVGLVLAAPSPGSPEEAVIERLSRRGGLDQAQLFYQSAKHHADPTNGLEDADFWSVQALALISIYMLSISKRNAAHSYLGMAVRSAYSLGLHREEVFVMFEGDRDQFKLRCNLWRSIFILDRFIAFSLGRPTAISEDYCSEVSFASPANSSGDETADKEDYHSKGLDAAVHSTRTISLILEKIYAQRRFTNLEAQDLAQKCSLWTDRLSPRLQGREAQLGIDRQPAGYGVAILHVNLLHCHSVILLSRPYLAQLLQSLHPDAAERCKKSMLNPRVRNYAEICVSASCHTILMIQNAYEGGYFSRRNPFIMYFLFSAALDLLSNEFAQLFFNPIWESRVDQAINLMSFSAEVDPQGKRLREILRMFRNDVDNRTGARTRSYRFPLSRLLSRQSDPGFDPIPYFFPSNSNRAGGASNNSHQRATTARRSSMPSLLGPTPTSDLQPIISAPMFTTIPFSAGRSSSAPLPPVRSSTAHFGASTAGMERDEPNLLSCDETEPITFGLDWPMAAQLGPVVGFATPAGSTSASRRCIFARAPLYPSSDCDEVPRRVTPGGVSHLRGGRIIPLSMPTSVTLQSSGEKARPRAAISEFQTG